MPLTVTTWLCFPAKELESASRLRFLNFGGRRGFRVSGCLDFGMKASGPLAPSRRPARSCGNGGEHQPLNGGAHALTSTGICAVVLAFSILLAMWLRGE